MISEYEICLSSVELFLKVKILEEDRPPVCLPVSLWSVYLSLFGLSICLSLVCLSDSVFVYFCVCSVFVCLSPPLPPLLSLSISLPPSLPLSLPPSLSHTHTRSLCVSVSVSLSLSVCVSVCLSVSLSVSVSLSLSVSVCLSVCLSLSHRLVSSLSVFLSLVLTHYSSAHLIDCVQSGDPFSTHFFSHDLGVVCLFISNTSLAFTASLSPSCLPLLKGQSSRKVIRLAEVA